MSDVRVPMKMKMSGQENLKHFASILHYMKAVDKDLKMEATPHSLILRALNGPKTAYSSVELSSNFFDHGTYSTTPPLQRDDPCFSCKLPVKFLCGVAKSFKNCNTLSLRAEITEETQKFELVCELHSPNQIKCRYRFKYEEGDHLSAVFDTAGASYLSSQHVVLSQAFTHLHACPEMIVTATESRFKMRSYRPPSDTSTRFLDSEFDIDAHNNFDVYEFLGGNENESGNENENENAQEERGKKQFVCCTREIKAMLHMCESLNIMNVDFHFFEQGRPIQVSVRDDVMTTLLVMTTIDKPAPPSPSAATSRATSNVKGKSKQKDKKKEKTARAKGMVKRSQTSESEASSTTPREEEETTTNNGRFPSQTSEGLSSVAAGERSGENENENEKEEEENGEETKYDEVDAEGDGRTVNGAKARAIQKRPLGRGRGSGKPPPQKKAAPHAGLGRPEAHDDDDDDDGGDDDDDDDGAIGRGRRRGRGSGSQQQQQQEFKRRVILEEEEDEDEDEGNDDDDNDNATQPEPGTAQAGHSMPQSEFQSQSQPSLTNSPSLPGSDKEAVSALTDMSRRRLHSGPAPSSAALSSSSRGNGGGRGSSVQRGILDSDSD